MIDLLVPDGAGYGVVPADAVLPDARDGRPHVAHGMVRQFTVR